MKVIDLLERRRRNWQELDQLCDQVQGGGTPKMPPANITRFGALYRAAQEQTQSPKFDVPLMRRRAREIIAALEPAAL